MKNMRFTQHIIERKGKIVVKLYKNSEKEKGNRCIMLIKWKGEDK